MAGNVSETFIANLALAKISAKAITTLSDASPEARWCARFYAQCRDEAMAVHPWNFAMRRVALSRLPGAPLSEWAFAYALPADFLDIYQLNAFLAWERPELFQIEAGALLTDAEAASIRYTFQQTDTTKFSALFVKALSDLLASQIAKPITGNEGTPWLQQFEGISLPRARRADARMGRPRVKDPISQSDLVRSRYFSSIG